MEVYTCKEVYICIGLPTHKAEHTSSKKEKSGCGDIGPYMRQKIPGEFWQGL